MQSAARVRTLIVAACVQGCFLDIVYSAPAPAPEHTRRKKKYVVVGGGVAGRSCISHLVHSSVDGNDILLIDSNVKPLSHNNLSSPVETTTNTIIKFCGEEQTIEFASGEVVEFEKCLLAIGKETGRIGAQHVSPGSLPVQVMHLRSSTSSEQVQVLKELVSNYRHVTLLGGSWSSLAIASCLAQHQAAPGLVTMVLPGSGPLHQVLPRYLTEALNRRLAKQGIDLLPYSQVRYVGDKETLNLPFSGAGGDGSSDMAGEANKELELELEGDFVVMHVCCSFDSLRTSMFPTDAVVLTAEEDASLWPHEESRVPSGLVEVGESPPTRSWLYHSGLEVDHYGSVVVNRSLLAAENIYAAGDLASRPYTACLLDPPGAGSEQRGRSAPHRTVPQRGNDVGLLNAEQTGALAAKNMLSTRGHAGLGPPSFHAAAPFSGLHFRFYGDCSNAHSSYSYWLKSPSSLATSESNSSGAKKKMSRALLAPEKRRHAKSLYGKAGVIFYVDSSHIIRGLLLCGPTSGVEENAGSNEHSVGVALDGVHSTINGDDPTYLIGEKAMETQTLDKGLAMTSLEQHAEALIRTHFKVLLGESTGSKKKRDGNSSTTASPARNETTCILPSKTSSPPSLPLRLVYARPRPLNGGTATGANAGLTNKPPDQHPWRYSVQSTITTEPVFYRTSLQSSR